MTSYGLSAATSASRSVPRTDFSGADFHSDLWLHLSPHSRVMAVGRRLLAPDFEALQATLGPPFLEQLVECVDARRVDTRAQTCSSTALVVVVAGCAGFEERSIVDLELVDQIHPRILSLL